jgi:hypothetical protein
MGTAVAINKIDYLSIINSDMVHRTSQITKEGWQ